MIGLAYSEMETDTTMGVLERSGLMFVINSTTGILTVPRVYFFFDKRATVMHELQSRVMHPMVYLVCQSLVDLTLRLICVLPFCMMLLAIVPLSDEMDKQVTFTVIVVTTALTIG